MDLGMLKSHHIQPVGAPHNGPDGDGEHHLSVPGITTRLAISGPRLSVRNYDTELDIKCCLSTSRYHNRVVVPWKTDKSH